MNKRTKKKAGAYHLVRPFVTHPMYASVHCACTHTGRRSMYRHNRNCIFNMCTHHPPPLPLGNLNSNLTLTLTINTLTLNRPSHVGHEPTSNSHNSSCFRCHTLTRHALLSQHTHTHARELMIDYVSFYACIAALAHGSI
uniref:Uncharacterized protein n=1 Tax=Lotharella oceanica TaxID=641309 RepID=A0A7S2XCS1_9EUKA|mmetsp:Transcript_27576/g.51439  ORF Transcript_27576/g.51439 Transcript_27576/m.51439 type:complete len:140 (+) Transcript_27576:82-501(+)